MRCVERCWGVEAADMSEEAGEKRVGCSQPSPAPPTLSASPTPPNNSLSYITPLIHLSTLTHNIHGRHWWSVVLVVSFVSPIKTYRAAHGPPRFYAYLGPLGLQATWFHGVPAIQARTLVQSRHLRGVLCPTIRSLPSLACPPNGFMRVTFR